MPYTIGNARAAAEHGELLLNAASLVECVGKGYALT